MQANKPAELAWTIIGVVSKITAVPFGAFRKTVRVAPATKPAPDRAMVEPAGPLVGVMVKPLDAKTSKVWVMGAPRPTVLLPEAAIRKPQPAALSGTLKVAVQEPRLVAVIPLATTLLMPSESKTR